MSNDKKIMDKYDSMLSYYRVGCGFLAVLSFGSGLRYSLYSIFQLGILMLLITVLISFLLKLRKLETSLCNSENMQQEQDIEGDEKPPNKGKKRKSDPRVNMKNFLDVYHPLLLILASVIGIFIEVIVFLRLRETAYSDKSPVFIGIFSIAISFIFLLSANLFQQSEETSGEYKMLGCFFRAVQWLSFLGGLSAVIKYLGFGQVEYWLSYLTLGVLMVTLLETGLQGIGRLFDGKDKQSLELKLYMLPALLSGKNPVNKLLDSLEENTGISFRSTWTIYFIKRNILLMALIIVSFFWLTTAFVQINPDEKGLLYTLGKIESHSAMLPGVHMKLPWPFQKVKIYPAYKVKNFTVGYEADRKSDYLWTMPHYGEEYKLLLGDGKELVSINMQVYYKIGDLYEYAFQYDNPEEKLKAEAYRILLNETVTTNLDKLLSRDRSSFSKMVTQKLQETSKQQSLGLEVTNVALTSIHPPTEIAQSYQEIVSADIQKLNIITEAKTYADSSIPKAEKEKNETVKTAQVEALTRLGQAYGEADKYIYQQKAYEMNTGSYKEWKWLEVLENALKGKKIYLLDRRMNIQNGGIWLDMRNQNGEPEPKASEENTTVQEDKNKNSTQGESSDMEKGEYTDVSGEG